MCLWGEDSEKTVKSKSQATRRARPHPFAIDSEDLAEIYPGKHKSVGLLLPSVLTAPLDSPELVRLRSRPEPKQRPALLPWSMPVVCFAATSTPEVLNQNDHEIRQGSSIDYLAELCDFAADLAERGRVLPTITPQDQGYAARWRPVLQGADLVAVEALAAAMPPICRAEKTSADSNGQSPAELLSSALGALVDNAARRCLAHVSMSDVMPSRRGRPPVHAPVAEVWL